MIEVLCIYRSSSVRSCHPSVSYSYRYTMMPAFIHLLILLFGCTIYEYESVNAEECYETFCYGEWIYKSNELGKCVKEQQTDAAEQTLIYIHEAVLESDIKVGASIIGNNTTYGGDNNSTTHVSNSQHDDTMIVRGLNAVVSAKNIPNSEGMYFCVYDKDTNKDSFYWVQNCNVLLEGASGNENLCKGLTDIEAKVGTIGYVVDAALTGTTDKEFIRYVFNETHAVKTEVQPIDGATEFSCSDRPWYQKAMTCSNPAKVLCPTITTFQGTSGSGTFQLYGDKSKGVVVAQDVAFWNLCQCLDDLTCDTSSDASRYQTSLLAYGYSLGITAIILGAM